MRRGGGHGGGMDDDDRSHAQIPTSFGPELRACLRCRLVKTYDQVHPASAATSLHFLWLQFSVLLSIWLVSDWGFASPGAIPFCGG
jgi:hypothetical protein